MVTLNIVPCSYSAVCPPHYWPKDCQICDTIWQAWAFECQIAGHVWRYDVNDDVWQCGHCGRYRSTDAMELPHIYGDEGL
jgi:hypothetical protein